MKNRTHHQEKKLSTLLEQSIGWLLLIVFAGVVVHAPISVLMQTYMPDIALLGKAWKELLIVLAAALMMGVLTYRHEWRRLLSDTMLRIIAMYIAVHLLLLLPFWQGVLPSVAGLMIDLRYIVFFALVFLYVRLYLAWSVRFLWAGLIAAVVALIFGVLQAFLLPHDVLKYLGYSEATIVPYLTVDMNYDHVRINSTFRGPNPAGAYAIIAGAVLLAWLLRGRKKLALQDKRPATVVALLALSSLVLVWYSYSRSALVGFIGALGIVVVVALYSKIGKKVWLLMAGALACLVVPVVLFWHTDFVQNVIVHDNPTTGPVETSNDGHFESLQEGTARMSQQPFGAGIGSAGSASLYGDAGFIVENQYLYIAHEAGWLGLVLFIALFALVMQRLWKKRADWLSLGVFASGVGLALVGILLPVWADDTIGIVWWGLAAIALAAERRRI